jgi:hypothetical protein
VLGVVVRRGGDRYHDEAARDAHGLSKSTLRRGDVLEHLQHRHDVEGTIVEVQRGGVHLSRIEPRDAPVAHGRDVGDSPRIVVDRQDGQVRERVQQGPQERAAAASDVEEIGWAQPLEDTQYSPHAG